MGTSVSHGSPRTSNWKPVLACYTSDKIPHERTISEVWRASENEKQSISSMIKSEAIFKCYDVVGKSKNYKEALEKFNATILQSKQNSIVAEFAKRVIPLAFQSKLPQEQWKSSFFSELTNYVVSRDTSGFVGDKFRNKSVSDLIEFKRNINQKVAAIVSSEKMKISSQHDWNSFVDKSISKLKSAK